MRRAVVLQHTEFEGPGRIGEALTARGCELHVVHVHRGQPVPADIGPTDVLVVMGGPMSVGDNERHPFLVAELALLRKRLELDAPTLGVCLGAQLLANAAGAAVYPMTPDRGFDRRYELGWAPVLFHPIKKFGLLTGIPLEAVFLHWHGDTFDLPEGARLLASTAACRNQAFQLKQRLYGLQFHCEVALSQVEAMARADAEWIVRANGEGAVERLIGETRKYTEAFRPVADHLIDNVLEGMLGSG